MSIINRWSDCVESPENKPIYVPDDIWKTSSGEEITVSGMTDEHIYNCLQFVKGKNPYWEYVFQNEIKRRKGKKD